MPFTSETLGGIFKTDPDKPERMLSRENGCLELKEAFNWNSREVYAKTMAAFANNQGGYIVFGVSDSPRLLVGLKRDTFSKIYDDPRDLAEFLNSTFSPEIKWDTHVHQMGDKFFGLIHVAEAATKPVVCRKSGSDIKEGAIYYRYRGRSEAIKYPEIRDILDAERVKERELWMKHIQKMSRTGINNVGVLDLQTGEVSGSSGTFLISEELLPKLKFINEGHFVESGGNPTLKMVGEVKTVGKGVIKIGRTKYESRGIHAVDIVSHFLEQRKVDSPEQYVTEICFGNTHYLPVYYYIGLAGWKVTDAVDAITRTQGCCGDTKTKLLQRLSKPERMPREGSISGATDQSLKRAKWLERLRTGTDSTQVDATDDFKYVFEATTHLERGEFDPQYVLAILRSIITPRYSQFAGIAKTLLRKAVAHLDVMLYPLAAETRADSPRPSSKADGRR